MIVTDFTKQGTLTTSNLNRHVAFLETCLRKNPKSYLASDRCRIWAQVLQDWLSHLFWLEPLLEALFAQTTGHMVERDCTETWTDGRSRLIEDKLQEHRLGVRDLRLAVDMSEVHGNSDRPSYFNAYLCVPDVHLPAKGIAYRANRHDDQTVKASEISEVCNSDLWKLQGLPMDMLPQALPEAKFCVPSAKAHLSGQDGRRNLTDVQETAQWVSGESMAISLLKALLGSQP